MVGSAFLEFAAQAESARARLCGQPGATQFIAVTAEQAEAFHLCQLPGAAGRQEDAQQFANARWRSLFPMATEMLPARVGPDQR